MGTNRRLRSGRMRASIHTWISIRTSLYCCSFIAFRASSPFVATLVDSTPHFFRSITATLQSGSRAAQYTAATVTVGRRGSCSTGRKRQGVMASPDVHSHVVHDERPRMRYDLRWRGRAASRHPFCRSGWHARVPTLRRHPPLLLCGDGKWCAADVGITTGRERRLILRVRRLRRFLPPRAPLV